MIKYPGYHYIIPSPEQEFEIFTSKPRASPASAFFQDCLIKFQFPFLQDHLLLLDGMAHDQPGDGYLPGLADAVGPVRSLILDGRIPPGIHVVDIRSPCELEEKA